jgi:hypothetical protein
VKYAQTLTVPRRTSELRTTLLQGDKVDDEEKKRLEKILKNLHELDREDGVVPLLIFLAYFEVVSLKGYSCRKGNFWPLLEY